MKMEHPRCVFCNKRVEYNQPVFAVKGPAGQDGFSHIDHEVPDEIKRIQKEALLYVEWVNRGYGLDTPVKMEAVHAH